MFLYCNKICCIKGLTGKLAWFFADLQEKAVENPVHNVDNYLNKFYS